MKKIKTKKENRIKDRLGGIGIVSFVVIAVYCLSLILVLYWGLLTSVKYQFDFKDGNFLFGFPRKSLENGYPGWYFENYSEAFRMLFIEVARKGQRPRQVFIYEMYFNSLLIATAFSFFKMFISMTVAYCVSKFEFKLGKVIYAFAIFVMLIPIVGSLASELDLSLSLGLYDNFFGVCLMKTDYTGIYFLVFYAAFKGISWTYAEAAEIDGANYYLIYFKIMIPLVLSTASAVFVLQFIMYWNDYYIQMMFLPSMPTVAYGLYYFQFSYQQSSTIPNTIAAAMLACIPTLIIFIIFRNKIMGNLAIGGIKG